MLGARFCSPARASAAGPINFSRLVPTLKSGLRTLQSGAGAILACSLLGLALATSLSGCASAPRRNFTATEYQAVPGRTQRGIATWYGEAYRGKRTASGEKFNPDDFTAAHRTLRFGTVVEVRNLRNNRTVLVEINDRGPFGKNRIIDLSEAAARQLGMLAAGMVPVEIRLVRKRRRRPAQRQPGLAWPNFGDPNHHRLHRPHRYGKMRPVGRFSRKVKRFKFTRPCYLYPSV